MDLRHSVGGDPLLLEKEPGNGCDCKPSNAPSADTLIASALG